MPNTAAWSVEVYNEVWRHNKVVNQRWQTVWNVDMVSATSPIAFWRAIMKLIKVTPLIYPSYPKKDKWDFNTGSSWDWPAFGASLKWPFQELQFLSLVSFFSNRQPTTVNRQNQKSFTLPRPCAQLRPHPHPKFEIGLSRFLQCNFLIFLASCSGLHVSSVSKVYQYVSRQQWSDSKRDGEEWKKRGRNPRPPTEKIWTNTSPLLPYNLVYLLT